jgi:hypothetical protein
MGVLTKADDSEMVKSVGVLGDPWKSMDVLADQ